MTRKTTTYARKRRAGGRHLFNGAEWVNTIQRCAGYGELGSVAGFDVRTADAANMAEARVLGALDSLMRHTPPAHVERAFDTLAHALGVASSRALEIEPDEHHNTALALLRPGTEALQRAIERWQAHRHFGLDAPGRQELPDAIEVYRAILRASSPAQMEAATVRRMEILSNTITGERTWARN